VVLSSIVSISSDHVCFLVVNILCSSALCSTPCTLCTDLVWYGMVNVDLYGAIITKVSNALNTLVSGEKPGFQTLSKGLVVLLCSEVVRPRVPDHGAMHSEYSASDSG